jgi:hypothetical protein
MSTHHTDRKTESPDYPDAEAVGEHLVVDKTDWVPGKHPDRHRRWDGQRAYRERYLRCLRCGAERMARGDFPDSCETGE